jgi:hypothetical protein
MPQKSGAGKKNKSGDKGISINGPVANSTIIVGDGNSVNAGIAAGTNLTQVPLALERKTRPRTDSGKLVPFLCYAKENRAVVREFAERLKFEGWIDPWFDEDDILPGQIWQDSVIDAVRQSHAVLIFLSKIAVTSEGFFQKELKLALDTAAEKPEGTIFIIPIRIDDCEVPSRLLTYQYVDFFGSEPQKLRVYGSLILALRKRAEGLGIK